MAGFRTGYMDDALFDLAGVIERATQDLASVQFDTLVGTGLSGAVVVPALSLALKKKFVLIRKREDGSHHRGRVLGELGKRWIFVDDFVSSGSTRERVIDRVAECALDSGSETVMVGQYMYAERLCGEGFRQFDPDWTANYRAGGATERGQR